MVVAQCANCVKWIARIAVHFETQFRFRTKIASAACLAALAVLFLDCCCSKNWSTVVGFVVCGILVTYCSTDTSLKNGVLSATKLEIVPTEGEGDRPRLPSPFSSGGQYGCMLLFQVRERELILKNVSELTATFKCLVTCYKYFLVSERRFYPEWAVRSGELLEMKLSIREHDLDKNWCQLCNACNIFLVVAG